MSATVPLRTGPSRRLRGLQAVFIPKARPRLWQNVLSSKPLYVLVHRLASPYANIEETAKPEAARSEALSGRAVKKMRCQKTDRQKTDRQKKGTLCDPGRRCMGRRCRACSFHVPFAASRRAAGAGWFTAGILRTAPRSGDRGSSRSGCTVGASPSDSRSCCNQSAAGPSARCNTCCGVCACVTLNVFSSERPWLSKKVGALNRSGRAVLTTGRSPAESLGHPMSKCIGGKRSTRPPVRDLPCISPTFKKRGAIRRRTSAFAARSTAGRRVLPPRRGRRVRQTPCRCPRLRRRARPCVAGWRS